MTVSIVALTISFAALSYTIWSDRAQRRRDFLYSKIDRIVHLHNELEEDSSKITQDKRDIDKKFPVFPKDQSRQVYSRNLLRNVHETLNSYLRSAQDLYQLLYRHQYIFPNEVLARATPLYDALVEGRNTISGSRDIDIQNDAVEVLKKKIEGMISAKKIRESLKNLGEEYVQQHDSQPEKEDDSLELVDAMANGVKGFRKYIGNMADQNLAIISTRLRVHCSE